MVGSRLPRSIVAWLVLPLVALGGCRSNPADPATPVSSSPTGRSSAATQTNSAQRLKVVATVLPMYLFTKAVAGEAAQVEILLKPGTEVHEYQSTPGNVQTIAQANVVVKNGLGLEGFLDNTIQSAENPKLTVIDASKTLQPIESASPLVGDAHPDHGKSERDHKGAHTHEGPNPHVWLDPVRAKQQVETIRDGLIAADPANKATYQTNAAAYIQRLSELNQQFEQRLKGYRDRTFVTFHDAFPYLAQRYQLKQVAVVSIPEDQLSPQDVQEAVSAVKQFQVKALFSEPGVDNKLLSSLSQDLRLTLRSLDSLEAGQLDPSYYFTAMQANLQTLEAAFQ